MKYRLPTLEQIVMGQRYAIYGICQVGLCAGGNHTCAYSNSTHQEVASDPLPLTGSADDDGHGPERRGTSRGTGAPCPAAPTTHDEAPVRG